MTTYLGSRSVGSAVRTRTIDSAEAVDATGTPVTDPVRFVPGRGDPRIPALLMESRRAGGPHSGPYKGRILRVAAILFLFAAPALADTPAKPNHSVAVEDSKPSAGLSITPTAEDFKSVKGVALIGLISLAPAALLMFTSFVRINIVLALLRQALGSPQVPGNQVLAALALLLTLLVMRPVGEAVYSRAIEPYSAGKITAMQAWDAGSSPVKKFMIDQIERTNHVHYLKDLYDIAVPPTPGRFEPNELGEFPLGVVAPAFLLSELTTALMIGFMIYLPFLVVDLVVSAVLSAMGLFMLPPSLVAMPLKLVLFVLADGWLLVASALLRTFAI